MADSSITKRALASALKKLVCDYPFSKISISDICGLCGMNRKSFYYHFKDKYDLVNRLFDNELEEFSKQSSNGDDCVTVLLRYLYLNRDYYKRVFKIEGQNSFRSHFCIYVTHLLKHEYPLPAKYKDGMAVQFFADGFVCATERWLTDPSAISAERFSEALHFILDLAR